MSYAIYIAAINAECVLSALSYLMDTNKLGKVTAILTDNGSAFRNWQAIEAVVHARRYYTFAYSAWQKGSVERYNLQLRELFFPKGTMSIAQLAFLSVCTVDCVRQAFDAVGCKSIAHRPNPHNRCISITWRPTLPMLFRLR